MASLPRLLLRAEHERLRLERATREIRTAVEGYWRPFRPQLPAGPDGRRAEQLAFLCQRRRSEAAEKAECGTARCAVRTRQNDRPLPHQERDAGRQRRGAL